MLEMSNKLKSKMSKILVYFLFQQSLTSYFFIYIFLERKLSKFIAQVNQNQQLRVCFNFQGYIKIPPKLDEDIFSYKYKFRIQMKYFLKLKVE
jgi:hypothetical protein